MVTVVLIGGLVVRFFATLEGIGWVVLVALVLLKLQVLLGITLEEVLSVLLVLEVLLEV